jgi:hypothetical protein
MLNITSWNGQHPITVFVPTVRPPDPVIRATVDFVLHELDDHDGAAELRKLWGDDIFDVPYAIPDNGAARLRVIHEKANGTYVEVRADFGACGIEPSSTVEWERIAKGHYRADKVERGKRGPIASSLKCDGRTVFPPKAFGEKIMADMGMALGDVRVPDEFVPGTGCFEILFYEGGA